MNIYQWIQKNRNTAACLKVTVLDGPEAGDTALFIHGECVVSAKEGGLLEKYKDKFAQMRGSALHSVEGQRVFTEYFHGAAKLILCGAGTVGQALIPLAKKIGFELTVLEDRAEYAAYAKELGADQVICKAFESGLSEIPGDEASFFVVVTREHRFDHQCLKTIFHKEKAYLGMMGSRKRVQLLKDQLLEEGEDRMEVDALHAPIGLSIGAQTPEEIAISILAELIQVKNSKNRVEGFEEELLEELNAAIEVKKPVVLAEIVDRIGSTPRGVGAKMLIFEDGTKSGSIGGGVMEADVIAEAVQMIRNKTQHLLYEKDIEEHRGMLCGGSQLIWLENIQ